MLSFKEFFLSEAKFRKSPYNIHLKDFPMFSVFYERDLASSLGVSDVELREDLDNNLPKIGNILREAKTEIGRMGFSSMHANLVFANLSKYPNPNTGGGTGGLAFVSRRYMKVDYNEFLKSEQIGKNLVVHEWAHLWMMGRAKSFRRIIEEVYRGVFGKVEDHRKYEELFARKRLKLGEEINYFIDSLATKPSIQDVMTQTYTGSPDDIKRMIKKAILYSIESGMYLLGLDDKTHEIFETELGFVDEYIDIFYDSLVKTSKERQSDVQGIIDADLRENNFGIFVSINMERSLKNMIMDKIKSILFKYSDVVNITESELINYAKGSEGGFFRNYLKIVTKWYNSYGLSNSDEFWATAIEGFFKLPTEYKKIILNLMMGYDYQEQRKF